MGIFSLGRHGRKENPYTPSEAAHGSRPGTTLRPQPDAEGRGFRSPLLSYRAANLQGLGTCERQEDSFCLVNVLDVTLIREKGLLAVVADGMGGMRDGRQASQAVVASLKSDFASLDYQSDIPEQLRQSVLNASEKVRQLLDGDGGSTVIVCLFYQEGLYFASVGDSYLYLKRNGQLFRMNRPQNVQCDLYLKSIREGSVDPVPANRDSEKAALSHFVGMEGLDDVDFLRKRFPLADGDMVLICSDGVAGVLDEREICESLSLPHFEDICKSLESRLWADASGEYRDNYTAVLIKCEY